MVKIFFTAFQYFLVQFSAHLSFVDAIYLTVIVIGLFKKFFSYPLNFSFELLVDSVHMFGPDDKINETRFGEDFWFVEGKLSVMDSRLV